MVWGLPWGGRLSGNASEPKPTPAVPPAPRAFATGRAHPAPRPRLIPRMILPSACPVGQEGKGAAGGERLDIHYLKNDDDGLYTCTETRSGASASVRLHIRRPAYTLRVDQVRTHLLILKNDMCQTCSQVGSQSITLGWNESLEEASADTNHVIRFRSLSDPQARGNPHLFNFVSQ